MVIGTDGPCTVSSKEYKVLVDPAPRFVNSLPNLSKKTSEDGTGNCSVGFTWNHPQIAGGNTSTLYLNIYNPPKEVIPGQSESLAFGPGQHTISYSLVSGCDTKSTSFTITVTDDENPTISCPKNDTIYLNGAPNGVVNYILPQVTDNCIDTELLRIRGPIPGQRVEAGTHPVAYLGFDRGGRLVNCNFTIVVFPGSSRSTSLATCEDKLLAVNSPADECGALVTYTQPDCSGDCAGSSFEKVSGLASGSIFPVGENLVEFKLTDRGGNSSFCNLKIQVQPPPSRIIACNDASLVLPYGETYALKLTDFISLENLKDACGGIPTDVRIEPGQLNCEIEMSQKPITLSWKNSLGQPENCQANLTVSRTGKPDYGNLIPIFFNTSNGIFSSDPCNTNAAFQIGVTTQSRNNIASGFAYTEVCGNMNFTTRLKSISGFGHGGIQIQGSSKTITLAVEKSFEGIKQVIRLKGTINRGDGKGVETIAQTEGRIPQYLSFSRTGSQIIGKYSTDGINWTNLFTINESLPDCLNTGLYVLSPFAGPEVRAFFEFIQINRSSEAMFFPNFSNSEIQEPQVYPNPFSDELKIKGIGEDWSKIEWMDLNGKIIQRLDKFRDVIPTSHFKPGVYLIRIYSGENGWIKKVIKAN